MVFPVPDTTYTAIEKKVRRLTASASQAALSSADIQQAINTFYNQDFPYAIKLDQMRSVYSFYTAPYIDRYPLDVNFNQGVRAPLYVDGIPGNFFKDRDQFFNMWPRYPTKSQPIAGDGVTTSFSFTVGSVPFLSKSVTLGGVSTTGAAIQVSDDGNGFLYVDTPNTQFSIPPFGSVYPSTSPLSGKPIPGMYNQNTLNPGLNTTTFIGTVNYVTGAISVNFALAGLIPAAGTTMSLFVSQYTTGRPFSLLFWNNEFTIRPIPKLVHKIEIETYLTPVQFLQQTDNPILTQWWQYLAYGASCEILRERQDMEGVSNLLEGMQRQEGLVLERQGVEEVGQRNTTIFSSTQQGQGWNNFWGGWSGG